MILIEPKVEIIPQSEGLEGIYKQIELAGRTCYKSEDKITDNSAKDFVQKMINNGHTAMLEHGTVYLEMLPYTKDFMKYNSNKYSKALTDGNDGYVITNLRVLVENDWLNDLNYLGIQSHFDTKRVTVRFTCDRGVSHELVRHKHFVSHSSNTMKNKFRELLEG